MLMVGWWWVGVKEGQGSRVGDKRKSVYVAGSGGGVDGWKVGDNI